jgi:hypothetical protein
MVIYAMAFSGPYPCWQPSLAATADSVVLQAGHDYWLRVSLQQSFSVGKRLRTLSDPASMTSQIGLLFEQVGPTDSWTPNSTYVLNFRLIGRALSNVGIEPTVRESRGIRLQWERAQGGAGGRLHWSGASQSVQFTIHDIQGRVVQRFPSVSGGAGVLAWDGSDRDRGAVASGVYWARAEDASGRQAVIHFMIMH